MFQGSMVALVTPFNAEGKLDSSALENLLQRQLEAGTDAIVINGTTGESPTLSLEETLQLIRRTVQIVCGQVPIIAGTGSNCTATTIALSQRALGLGVDACLVIAPYYNRPTQAGLIAHYQALAEAVAMPLILYNHPGRTGCDLWPATVASLAKISNIIGIKEGMGDLNRLAALQELCEPDFCLFSGEDLTAGAFMLQGGHGVISVTANVAPRELKALAAAALKGQRAEALAWQTQLLPLNESLFLESNPIPVKWALSRMGLIENRLRLPLTPLSQDKQKTVEDALVKSGIIATARI